MSLRQPGLMSLESEGDQKVWQIASKKRGEKNGWMHVDIVIKRGDKRYNFWININSILNYFHIQMYI